MKGGKAAQTAMEKKREAIERSFLAQGIQSEQEHGEIRRRLEEGIAAEEDALRFDAQFKEDS